MTPHIIYYKNKQNNKIEFNLDKCFLTDDSKLINTNEYKNEVFEIITDIYSNYLENMSNNYNDIYLN